MPTGNLVNGVYDALGNYYQLPAWVVSDPEDITPNEEVEESGNADDDVGKEKGKYVLDYAQQITLTARLSETGKDLKISIGENELVKSIATRLVEESAVSPTVN